MTGQDRAWTALGRSAAQFCRRLGRRAWAVAISGSGGALGVVSGLTSVSIPTWVWAVLLVGGFVLAVFLAFHDEREMLLGELGTWRVEQMPDEHAAKLQRVAARLYDDIGQGRRVRYHDQGRGDPEIKAEFLRHFDDGLKPLLEEWEVLPGQIDMAHNAVENRVQADALVRWADAGWPWRAASDRCIAYINHNVAMGTSAKPKLGLEYVDDYVLPGSPATPGGPAVTAPRDGTGKSIYPVQDGSEEVARQMVIEVDSWAAGILASMEVNEWRRLLRRKAEVQKQLEAGLQEVMHATSLRAGRCDERCGPR